MSKTDYIHELLAMKATNAREIQDLKKVIVEKGDANTVVEARMRLKTLDEKYDAIKAEIDHMCAIMFAEAEKEGYEVTTAPNGFGDTGITYEMYVENLWFVMGSDWGTRENGIKTYKTSYRVVIVDEGK